MNSGEGTWVAGADGCRSGWVCALMRISGGKPVYGELRFAMDFAHVLKLIPSPAIIAVDMPIGLPERTSTGGRPPEKCVRPLLGARQSSVFAIPSRAAVYADAYSEACRIALETSDPPRKVSKQAFHIFPKIREIDALMTPQLQSRVYECHPEVALMQSNGAPAPLPKKVKSRINPDGVQWRIDFLTGLGIPPELFTGTLPRGVKHGRDDIADAAACALTAWRILEGRAIRYPHKPVYDAAGLDMAIWA
ncbi:MAG: DUF429 domain-containing protein [Rhodobiaceae bacterium]|nr:DUF429 domain-containing protein [Rhodobiaceae bacterium]